MCFEMYHVRLYIVKKMGFGVAPKRCGIHSKPQPLLQKTCLSYASETLAMYVGCGPRMQVKGYFGHFLSKNRFLLVCKGYIFHFYTP